MKSSFKLALLCGVLLMCVGNVWGAEPPVVAPDPKIPVIELPPDEKPDPATVAKFDVNVMKAREVPYHVALVKAPEAWGKNPLALGEGLRIAIVDTGCQADHPGFEGMVADGYNAITKKEGFPAANDDNDHGTHCAGIIHAILPKAKLYIVKAMDARGSGSVDALAHGIEYAATKWKCHIISCSFGGSRPDSYLPGAVKRATEVGSVVVCAAGNDGGGVGRDTEGYPARYPEAVSVAACDSNRQLASFSSWGPTVFTCDPGVEVWSLLPGTREGKMSGTSMACPVEAGKVGIWINTNGIAQDGKQTEKYREAVKKASPFPERNNARGYGLYQVDKVTGEAKTPPPTPVPPAPPAPGEKVFTISLDDLRKQGYTGVKIDLGTGAASQPVPVIDLRPTLPSVTGEPQQSVSGVRGVDSATVCVPGQGCGQAVQTSSGPGTVIQGYTYSTPVYQTVQQKCSGGQCQPVQQRQGLFGRWR